MKTNTTDRAEDEISLIDHVIVLLKWKKLIIGTTLSCMVIAAIIGLVMPKTYRAETRLLPPQQSSTGMASQLLSQIGGGAAGLGAMLSGASQADIYVGMLQSRTVLDAVIKKFDLKKRHDDATAEDARKRLSKQINVSADAKGNIIVISVKDKEPQRAADMANAFVAELRNMTKSLAVTEAAQRRLFFEGQLKDVKESLIQSEEGVKGFQEKTGTLHVDEQVKAVIKNIAQLRAEIAAKAVELIALKTYSRPSNPDVQKAEAILNGMRGELAKLESKNGAGNDPMMPTGRMPSVGTEYVRKLRDLKFHETLYELLLKQYEVARLDEARDGTVIQVIDRAVTPEKSIGPQRKLIVAIAAVAGFFLSVLFVYLVEFGERLIRSPQGKESLELLKSSVQIRDFSRWFPSKYKSTSDCLQNSAK